MPSLAAGHPLDLARLLETRMLIQANSGGGKSWALRRILEQTVSDVQQIVIDPEGEFSTLREKFDYIICAKNDADAVPQPGTAKLLARRLLETGVSAIIDIYELKANERKAFVRYFFEALVDAPKKLWHPVLIVLDEAHIFAPEKGKAESLGPVIDLATRGRKRGFCLIAATQRLAKLHKDVAAEMNNKMIGRTGLDIDVARAADELGMTKREAMHALKFLGEGEWYVFGPALSQSIEKLKVGPVVTSHPSVGDRIITVPPAPSSKIRKVLSQLADLPQQAEQEARTTSELKKLVVDLRRELRNAEKVERPSGITEADVQISVSEAVEKERIRFQEVLNKLSSVIANGEIIATKPPPLTNVTKPTVARKQVTEKPAHDDNEPLTGPEQRILNSLAWFDSIDIKQPDNTAVAFMAGYKVGGGYNNPKAVLHKRGLVQYGQGSISLTEEGRAFAEFPDIAPTTEELHRQVLANLHGPEIRVLQPLLDSYPDWISNEDLAVKAGYTIGGGFNNPKGRLRKMGLIEYPERGFSVARSILFPEGSKV